MKPTNEEIQLKVKDVLLNHTEEYENRICFLVDDNENYDGVTLMGQVHYEDAITDIVNYIVQLLFLDQNEKV
jgi:hypothetical protein